MKRLSAILILIVVMISCEEPYFPPGIYAVQVERLLSGGDQKVWQLSAKSINGDRQELSDCSDLTELHVYDRDSGLVIYELTTCSTPDSIYWGLGQASVSESNESNPNLFTDTLVLEGGAYPYVLISEITSLSAKMNREANGGRIVYDWSALD